MWVTSELGPLSKNSMVVSGEPLRGVPTTAAQLFVTDMRMPSWKEGLTGLRERQSERDRENAQFSDLEG